MTLDVPDPARVTELWTAFAAERGIGPDVRPVDVFSFGDSVTMADELLDLVTDGTKRATASAVAEYEVEGMPVPRVGDFCVVCDGRRVPRMVIETADVRVGALSSVDEAFAWDEGEGDRTRAVWLRSHTSYFRRSYQRLGLVFHPDIDVVFERFDVVFTAGA